jgi:acyl carrier protein
MDERELRNHICEVFLAGDLQSPIDADTLLLDEGICDSLGIVQMVGWIESQCPGIRIWDQEVTRENFGSINRTLSFLRSKGA